MIKKRLLPIILILLLVCNMSPVTALSEDTVRIAASFYPVWVLAQNLLQGIDGIELVCLAAPTTGCLHDYQLLTGDIRTLHTCDALIICGAGMESYLDDITGQLPSLHIIDSSTGIALLPSESGETPFNAHIWLSPINAIQMLSNMAEGLGQLCPEHTDMITENLTACTAALLRLDDDIRKGLENIQSRNIVTFHEAFPYFAAEYDLNVVAVVALEPDESLSPRMLAELINIINRNGTPPLFTEPQYAASPAYTVARETGARVYELDPLVTGTGIPESYIEGMYRNLEVLKEALSD